MIGSSILSNTATQQVKFPIFTSNLEQVRTKVRKHFARPSERKRIKAHGWETRLKTPSGRAIIMRRILAGRHTLSH